MDPPPRPSPAMERWQHIQSQKLFGMVGMGAGVILGLLGLIRIIFAFVEKKYDSNAGSIAPKP
jgi:hypothetical protein